MLWIIIAFLGTIVEKVIIYFSILVENIRFNPDIKTSAGDLPSIIKFSSFCV